MESCDRQSLVVPILGLYGELLRAAHDGIKGGNSDISAVKAFLKEVETHQEDVFPRKFSRVIWRKNKRVVEEVTLFGDLIDRMRARIKNGNMFVPVERGGTESTMSSTDFLRHGANDSIMHGVMDVKLLVPPAQDNFLRHGSLNAETPNASTGFVRHGGGGEEEA
jgi:hypothetical protein